MNAPLHFGPAGSTPAATHAATTTSAAVPTACDVLVVGGGINGVGIARDLAGRGVSVVLCEKDDLAAHTSSSSTKLIHGGLRYLEYYEFSLVRKALAEREVLLKSAPHIMWPLRFVMPHDPSMRPVWMIRAGLFLYDHLARREVLPASTTVNLRTHPTGAPLKPQFTKGFVYSDGWVDDARLVVSTAVDAAARGATVLTRTACVDAVRSATGWQASLVSAAGARHTVRARALVNAAGPWAAQFLAEHAHAPRAKSLRLVKGSHIVVPRLFDHDHAYIFQNPDKRIIFAIPYEADFTLIGTTDVEHRGAIGAARIDADEVAYLCTQASRYFARPVAPSDVVWSYAGVRPLLEDDSGDPSSVTRDYALELDTVGPDNNARQAPLLSVWGGKITTFRKLAEEAADLLAAPLGNTHGAWTRGELLPGGDLTAWIGAAQPPVRGVRPPEGTDNPTGHEVAPTGAVGQRAKRAWGPVCDFARFTQALVQRHPHLPPRLPQRLARAYGSRVDRILTRPMGTEVAPGLYEAELDYLHDEEWARSADDVLWRRSKLGLHLDATERQHVADWCALHWGPVAVGATTEATSWN